MPVCLAVDLCRLLGHVESSTGATIIPRDLLQASKRKQAGDWLKVHQHLLKNKDYQITQEMEVKRRHVFRAVVADYPTFRPGSRLHPPPQVELIVAVRLYYVFKSRADVSTVSQHTYIQLPSRQQTVRLCHDSWPLPTAAGMYIVRARTRHRACMHAGLPLDGQETVGDLRVVHHQSRAAGAVVVRGGQQ